MALNDILKHMPSIGHDFSDYAPSEELDFMNLTQHKVLAAPPYPNVSFFYNYIVTSSDINSFL